MKPRAITPDSPRSRSARSASSSATSGRARCTRCRRCSPPTSTRCRPTQADVYGVISLVFWAITIIVSIKYVDADHARRQRGRGRHHGPDRADPRDGALQRRVAQVALVALGHLRRLAVLRRRHDHAGDLGAVGGRGPRGRRARACSRLRRADHARDPDRAVRDPALRHRRGRPAVRPDHGACGSRCWRSPGLREVLEHPGDPARALAHLRASRSCSSTGTSRSSRSARSC